jgi:hypothetical protein
VVPLEKKASLASARIKNELQEKLSEFTWESESCTEKDNVKSGSQSDVSELIRALLSESGDLDQ